LFTDVFTGQPDDWVLMASNAGYGFRVQLKELISKNKAGKAFLSLPPKTYRNWQRAKATN
jgi:topoisomerase-4 subunit A